MNVRSLDELVDFIDSDLGKRKHELVNLDSALSRVKGPQVDALRRAGFMLVYAHFEGFIKSTGTAYFFHIRHQRLAHKAVKPSLIAASIKGQLEAFIETNRSTMITTIVETFVSRMGDDAIFDWKGELDTRSNLSSDVFREIACLLGIDFTPYSTKQVFIDRELLKNRNEIAHGDHVPIDKQTYEQAKDQVLDLIERFRTDVQNAAATRAYIA